jgi:CRP-like cAMP-binding protein
VVTQGGRGDAFFIIESGRAQVVHDGQVVDELGPGDYFGEIALLEPGGVRAATVVAVEAPLQLLRVRREVFNRVLGPLRGALQLRVPSYRRAAAGGEGTPVGKGKKKKKRSQQQLDGVVE